MYGIDGDMATYVQHLDFNQLTVIEILSASNCIFVQFGYFQHHYYGNLSN
jgi:hypothetical protein